MSGYTPRMLEIEQDQQIDLAEFLNSAYYAYGLPMSAISDQLGVSMSTVRTYLARTIPEFVSFRHRQAAFQHVRAAIMKDFQNK